MLVATPTDTQCLEHARLSPQTPVDTDLSACFPGQLDEFRSAEQVNAFLATLVALLVQNRISSRRASVLAYITNQLLHTVTAIQREQSDVEEPQQVLIDFIRPKPDDSRRPLSDSIPGFPVP
jgi:hypothetical protein